MGLFQLGIIGDDRVNDRLRVCLWDEALLVQRGHGLFQCPECNRVYLLSLPLYQEGR